MQTAVAGMNGRKEGVRVILFLDFDGVLHPLSRGLPDFVLAPLLAPALEAFPETKIVLSTSWRTFHELDALRDLLPPFIAERVIGATPLQPCRDPEHFDSDWPRWPVREHLCRDWLRDNERDATRWIALDDDRDSFSASAPVVWCDPTTGLDTRTIEALISHLSRASQPTSVSGSPPRRLPPT